MTKLQLAKVKEKLEDIQDMAFDHPCFDQELFDSRDFVGAAKVGGDVCDWTVLGIYVTEALEILEESK